MALRIPAEDSAPSVAFEGTRTWQAGCTAFVMLAIAAIAIDLLRGGPWRWTDATPITRLSTVSSDTGR